MQPIYSNNLPSFKAYKHFGASRNLIDFESRTNFHISPLLAPCFQTYFMRKWEAQYTLDLIVEGKIMYGDRVFHVVFKTPRGAILSRLDSSSEVNLLLSFRAAAPEFSLPAHVIIKLA